MTRRGVGLSVLLALAACGRGTDGAPDPIEPAGCSAPCGAHATCTAVGQSHACVCDEGFAGDGLVCRQTCASSGLQCGSHGRCDDAGVAAVCQCDFGYTGTLCDGCASTFQDNDGDGTCEPSCEMNGCGPRAQCSDLTGVRVCTCDTGYTGADCLACDAGYQDNDLDGTCEPDCATSGLDCGAHGVCSDFGTAWCACDEGYAGVQCEGCAAGFQDNDGDGSCLADCAKARLAGCGGFGTCDDASGETVCTCDALAHACDGSCCPDMVAVSVGQLYSCALSAANGIKCWGNNEFGQLGSMPVVQENPVPLDGPSFGDEIRALATGQEHTCVALSTGELKCWGYDGRGQLGTALGTEWHFTWIPQTVPVALSATSPQITCGGFYTCAVTSTGGVKCWGANDRGQLGDGTTATSRWSPVDVVGLTSGVKTVVAGAHFSSWQHTCALLTTGAVKCWGDNWAGQLGDGNQYTESNVPVDVVGLDGEVVALAVGRKISCALLSAGEVKCWGTPGLTPTTMAGLERDVTAIALNELQLCAVKTGGRLQCQGDNGHGQLGDGTTVTRLTLADVEGMTSGTSLVRPGADHACAVTDRGDVLCWGSRTFGAVGPGGSGDQLTPLRVDFSPQ